MAILGVIILFKGTCDAALAFAWGLLSCLEQRWLKCLCSQGKKVIPTCARGTSLSSRQAHWGSVPRDWFITSCLLSQCGAALWHIHTQQHPIPSFLLFFKSLLFPLVEMAFLFCSWQPTAQANTFLSCPPTVTKIHAQNFSKYPCRHSDDYS